MNRYVSILLLLVTVLVSAIITPVGAYGQQEDAGVVHFDSIAQIDTIPIVGDSVMMPADSIPQNISRKPRTATPVDIDEHKETPIMHYYDIHGEPLDEPVMFLASLDTIEKPKVTPDLPLYNGVSVGVNFFDAAMLAFGQKYGSFDIAADVSLYNWFFPVVEVGIGFADSTPENQNFNYKVKPSFYAKIGLNYNFLYKSNPDYQVYLGLRAAMSSFNWEVRDVTINSDYWQQTEAFNMGRLHSTAFWGEALAGVKVKIVGNFSLGWNVRWHFPFHVSKGKAKSLPEGMVNTSGSKPWFIPGYGGSQAFAFTFSAIWTI